MLLVLSMDYFNDSVQEQKSSATAETRCISWRVSSSTEVLDGKKWYFKLLESVQVLAGKYQNMKKKEITFEIKFQNN